MHFFPFVVLSLSLTSKWIPNAQLHLKKIPADKIIAIYLSVKEEKVHFFYFASINYQFYAVQSLLHQSSAAIVAKNQKPKEIYHYVVMKTKIKTESIIN